MDEGKRLVKGRLKRRSNNESSNADDSNFGNPVCALYARAYALEKPRLQPKYGLRTDPKVALLLSPLYGLPSYPSLAL